MLISISSSVDILNRIQKFSTHTTKSVCQTFFQEPFFNRFRIQYESGALQTNFSKIDFFLPSITDRVEDINRHMFSFNLLLIDISKDTFEVDGVPFDPFKLDYDNPDKEKNVADCRENA